MTYTYDANGNLTQRTDPGGTSTFTFDDLNRVTAQTLPGGRTINYGYDANGNLTSLTDAGGTTSYSYSDGNDIVKLREPDTSETVFTYYSQTHNLKTKTHPNGVVETSDWFDAGHLKSIEAKKGSTVIAGYDYSYTQAGTTRALLQKKTERVGLGQPWAYEYDNVGRLKAATWTDSGALLAKYEYTYDAAGNLRTRIASGTYAIDAGTTTYTYDEANRLKGIQNGTGPLQAVTYDKAGNETANPSGRTLTYNPFNQTTAINSVNLRYLGAEQNVPDGEGAVDLTYNALGLGVRKDATTGASTYIYRDDSGGLIGQKEPTGESYFTIDGQGSVIATTDAGGSLKQKYRYDPYGRSVVSFGSGFDSLFSYVSGVRKTGGLIQFGQRYYDPMTQRWTQPDPLDQAGDLRQANKYEYAGSDPVNYTDVSGEAYFRGTFLCGFVPGCNDNAKKAIQIVCVGVGAKGLFNNITKIVSFPIRRASAACLLYSAYNVPFGG